MSEIDPLGRDVLLVFFGTVFAVFFGVTALETNRTVSVPAIAVGVALPLVVALLWPYLQDRVAVPRAWHPWREDTGLRGRLTLLALVLGAFGLRFGLGLLPDPIQDQFILAVVGATATMAIIGLGRALRRTVATTG